MGMGSFEGTKKYLEVVMKTDTITFRKNETFGQLYVDWQGCEYRIPRQKVAPFCDIAELEIADVTASGISREVLAEDFEVTQEGLDQYGELVHGPLDSDVCGVLGVG